MANLYTRTGDGGKTSLIGGSRVSKGDIRVDCYGTVDEMGAALGFARSLNRRDYIKDVLYKIQTRLFSLAAELACDEEGLKKLKNLIDEKDISYLEGVVDKCTETAGVQTEFVVPGENQASGALHYARTVVRRCERSMIRLTEASPVRLVLIKYVNRLSDAVYALARYEETLNEQECLKRRIEEEARKCLASMNLNPPFTLENVEHICLRAKEKAQEMGVPIVFAAVDEGGNLLLLKRMEGSLLGSIDVAYGKAFTANAFKQSTDELGKLAKGSDSEFYSLENIIEGKIILFGGGYPYYYNGKVVGAIGVSGGSAKEDMLIARYALGDLE